MNDQALFFAVSGLASPRTCRLYYLLEDVLPRQFPDKKIAFLGNPYEPIGRRKFTSPLFWSEEERGVHATTRILSCWKRLNEFNVTQLRPALYGNDVVVTLRLGVDAVVYSTSFCDKPEDVDEAERVHHALVRMRIVEQGIKPPTYFIPRASEDDIAHLIDKHPSFDEIDPCVRINFLAHERSALERYFDPKHGQMPAQYLATELTMSQMTDEVMAIIEERLQMRKAA